MNVQRPDGVPVDLAPAWALLEQDRLGAVVVDVDGGVLWPTLEEPDRLRELGRRLASTGNLHPSLTAASFAVARARAAEQAGAGAPLSAVWERVPTWAHSGLDRADAVALDHGLLVASTVPDPDVARFLDAVAAARIPVSAVSTGPLSADQVRRVLEQPTLDAVTWRAVRTAEGLAADVGALAAEAAVPGPGAVLLLTARDVAADGPLRVVRLGRTARDGTALERLADRVATSGEAAAVPGALRDAWAEGAAAFGPLLAGFADWAVRHAAGHPGSPLVAVSEPGSLLPELLAEVVAARRLPVQVRTLPLTPELVAVADADGAAVGAALHLALAGDGRSPAAVAELLGLPGEHADLVSVATALTADPEARGAASARAGEVSAELAAGVAAPSDALQAPLILCGAGGSGDLQRAVSLALAAAGTPRHVVGLYLASGPDAADALVGPGGGEVLGYAANLGTPTDAHEAVRARRPQLEELLGAPDRSRTSLSATPDPRPDDLRALRVEATRRGVLALVRRHVRELEVSNDPGPFFDAGSALAARMAKAHAAPALGTPRYAADALLAPSWIDEVVAPLERELLRARSEVARRDEIVAGRAYRIVMRLRRLLARFSG